MAAERACFEELGAFGAAQDVIDYTNAAHAELKVLAKSAIAARNAALADSTAITELYEAADSARPPTAFEAFVESFVIPTEGGACAVQATRDKTFDTYDYFVYYLVGECAGQSVEVRFRKGLRFWRDHTQEYERDLTNKILDKRGRKTFVLEDGA